MKTHSWEKRPGGPWSDHNPQLARGGGRGRDRGGPGDGGCTCPEQKEPLNSRAHPRCARSPKPRLGDSPAARSLVQQRCPERHGRSSGLLLPRRSSEPGRDACPPEPSLGQHQTPPGPERCGRALDLAASLVGLGQKQAPWRWAYAHAPVGACMHTHAHAIHMHTHEHICIPACARVCTQHTHMYACTRMRSTYLTSTLLCVCTCTHTCTHACAYGYVCTHACACYVCTHIHMHMHAHTWTVHMHALVHAHACAHTEEGTGGDMPIYLYTHVHTHTHI